MGSDRRDRRVRKSSAYFNPRSPDGERPCHRGERPWTRYFNPRSPDGERRAHERVVGQARVISIHAPRMGSDPMPICLVSSQAIFQSTLPGWGATNAIRRPRAYVPYFNPRSPDGERHEITRFRPDITDFNPRSPDGERPSITRPTGTRSCYFNPRSPDGERPACARPERGRHPISIHAPRMGSDTRIAFSNAAPIPFQSTLPGWGATAQRHQAAFHDIISIHAPRMGSDLEYP